MGFRVRRLFSKYRFRTRVLHKELVLLPLIVLALVFFVLAFSSRHLILSELELEHSLAKTLISKGLPNTARYSSEKSPDIKLRSFIYLLTNYDLQDPLSLMEATLPLGPSLGAQLRVWEERPFVFVQELSFDPEPTRPLPKPQVVDEAIRRKLTAPKILIYHTHSSEMYLGRALTQKQANQGHYQFRSLSDPTITGVMAVGRHLTNALNKMGIETVHEPRIHTLPTISHSYANSERTVREILGKHDFDMVIDLHRDAGVQSPTTIINGRKVARLVLVVGTAERIPLSHPEFAKNLEFAQKIKSICDEMYPGLMRPIQVQREARYNQHLHPRSLIVELGSVENTLNEALLAAELLANVLVRTL
ncbi:MAG: stage II sporulation protein P [Bacillota bacterium]|nr:stage II sporulation protein P [Bacillota bacterium]HHU61814.1 hypothetical protein [Natronincola sp.]